MPEQAKIVMPGTGAADSTFAYALARNGFLDEIVLVNADTERAAVEAMDLNQGHY